MSWRDHLYVSAERPVPVDAVDSRWSAVSSAIDLIPRPTPELVGLLLHAAQVALETSVDEIADRGSAEQAAWTRLWPGEHYRLLAGLVDVVKPSTVVEIGTFHGTGTLALARLLPPGGKVVTFDIVPWDETPDCMLTADDFAEGRIEQILGDLSDPAVFSRYRDTVAAADLVFLDAPKDGRFEPAFLELALPLWHDRERLLVFDDVRLLPMLQLWRDLPLPKLDATSFGHWSGTGLALTGQG